jgi:hypothetical protein
VEPNLCSTTGPADAVAGAPGNVAPPPGEPHPASTTSARTSASAGYLGIRRTGAPLTISFVREA